MIRRAVLRVLDGLIDLIDVEQEVGSGQDLACAGVLLLGVCAVGVAGVFAGRLFMYVVIRLF